MSSSEKRFGISNQPGNTCPDIDGLISSIPDIGCFDDDGDLIEVDPDYGSIRSAQANVEDIKSWQEDWLSIGQKLYDRIDDILIAISEIENFDENSDVDITTEKEAYNHYFHNNVESLEMLKEQLDEHLKDFQKSIKDDFWDCESAYSDIYSAIDSNDENSVQIIENYRTTVVDFRSNGNYFKELIRDNAYDLLPEEIDEPSFLEQYELYLDEKEEATILANLKRLQEKNMEQNPEPDIVQKKENKRKKLSI